MQTATTLSGPARRAVQPVGQTVRPAIKLAITQVRVLGDHSDGIGPAARLHSELLVQAEFLLVLHRRCIPPSQLPLFRLAQQIQLAHSDFRILHYQRHGFLQMAHHSLNRGFLEQVHVIVEIDAG